MSAIYEVNAEGIIVSPGKFQGEPAWVPHFWGYALDGFGEDNPNGSVTVYVENPDIEQWPQLQGIAGVTMHVDDNGFVHHGVF